MLQSESLDMDPDILFEQFTVKEVESVLLSINNEIERKKVELRTLVGERYRDLIETADTISEMKSISEQFIKEVQIMNADMGQLKFKLGPPFKLDLVQQRKRSVSYSIQDSVAAQISILIDLPELVWSAISSRNYIKAAQLFLLGRHIKTGFSVDKNLIEFSDRFTVVEQQWNALTHFPNAILCAVENDLKTLEISSEEACNCLCAMALLESKELPDKLLELRLEAVEKSLDDNNVKTRIVESYNTIVKSLSILWDCFSTEKFSKQLFWKRLPLISSSSSPPVIKLMEKGIRLKYLPPIILQFRTVSLYSPSAFHFDDLSPKINLWIKKIKDLATRKGKTLLSHIVSLPALESLTNIQITNYREWDQLLVSFKIGDKFQLWNDVFKPLISARAKELISMHCNDAFIDIVNSLESAFQEDDSFKPDTDLRWFVWKDSADDLDVDNITNARGLLLKANGVTPKITGICKKFERNLITLYEDLSGLYSSDITLQSDNNDLKLHQQNAYVKLLIRLKEHIQELTTKESVTEAQLSIIARFLLAVPNLCPTLQKCLTLSVDNVAAAPWEEAKLLLETEGISVWSSWESKAVKRLEALIPVHLRKPTSYADLLNVIPQWEIVWIEEGTDGDGKHKSQLRVPSAPSFPLQAILHGLSTELAKSHLPRSVSENLMQKLMPKLIKSYDTSSPLCQAESLQNLFDVKYLLAQFIPITNKELSTLCQDKISNIEANIDPFDLDVFTPHITANIRSSVHRTQLLFGTYCLMRLDDGGINTHKMPEDPCTLALSKSNAWFPLIPVTNPISKPLHLVKPKIIKTTKSVPEPSSDMVKVSSSSFLSDWFG